MTYEGIDIQTDILGHIEVPGMSDRTSGHIQYTEVYCIGLAAG